MGRLLRIALIALLAGVCCLAGCASSGEEDASSSPASEAASSDRAKAAAEDASQNAEAAEGTEGDGLGNTDSAQGQDVATDAPQQEDPSKNEESAMSDRTASKAAVLLDGTRFSIGLTDNDTAAAFVQMLPLEVEMSELNSNEKYIYLDESLPAHPTNPGTIEAGDVMLYGDNCLVVFYESHPTSYTYTRIGTIADTAGLAEAVGAGSVSASFTLE